jgi:hypothetical protein
LKIDEIMVAYRLYWKYRIEQYGSSKLSHRIVKDCTVINLSQKNITGQPSPFIRSVTAYDAFEVLECILIGNGKDDRFFDDNDIRHLKDIYEGSRRINVAETGTLCFRSMVDGPEGGDKPHTPTITIDPDHQVSNNPDSQTILKARVKKGKFILWTMRDSREEE